MSLTTSLIDSLTDEQLAAATAEDPYVHVSAGPGSGKTRVLAARVAWLIERGVDPDEICCLTFTRSAAEEIRSRVEAEVGVPAERVAMSTFHERAILDGPPLRDEEDLASDFESRAALRSLYEGPTRRPGRDLPGLKELEIAIVRWEAASGARVVLSRQASRALDIVRSRLRESKLVAMWELLPRLREAQKSGRVRTYDHVLVDEAQDCTDAERMASARLARSGNLFAVGDRRQAIMGWRFANPDGWPPPTHELTKTFRFGMFISDLANTLDVGPPIGPADHCSFRWFDDFSQVHQRFLPRSAAVLVRTREDAKAMERAFPSILKRVLSNRDDPLSSPADRLEAATSDGKIPVLTVHAAKGREWDRVIVVGPSTIRWGLASPDAEERRVLYVAMTRARKELVLVKGNPDVPGWHVKANALDEET